MQPQVQSLDQILAQLDPAYAPQRTLFQQQQALIPGQTQTALTGLEATKQNAFRDVNTGANSKGLAFSGIPAAEQTRYLGEKYLPAVAGVTQDAQKQSLTLAQSLAQLESDKRLKGIDTQQGQQKSLDAYLEAERTRQFQAQQNALDRQAAAAKASSSGGLTAYQAAQLAKDAANQFKIKTLKSGNYSATGPNGAPISVFQYSQNTGNSFLDLLRNSGSAYDRKAYNDAQGWLKQFKGDENRTLTELQKRFPKLF